MFLKIAFNFDNIDVANKNFAMHYAAVIIRDNERWKKGVHVRAIIQMNEDIAPK